MPAPFLDRLRQCVAADDIPGATALLEREPEGLSQFVANCDCPPTDFLAAVRSAGMADVFLGHGVTTKMIGEWWAPGFGLNRLSAVVAEHLVQRGVLLTPHSAAALGLVDRLRSMIEAQPQLVHANGGDGARPLHFSRNVETAQLLVEHGAELNARDEDHDSTAAQWRIGDAPEVTRFLLSRGASADVFMASGLGDLKLAKRLVEENPACTSYRIGHNSGPFPGIGFRGRGGTIYQWTLGFNQSPQEIANRRGHRELFDFLMSRTPPKERFLASCMLADRPAAEALAAEFPNLVAELGDEDRALLAKCCWETNLNREAVRLMLDLGFPVDAPERTHGWEPLHNAAWCGDVELVRLLLERGHPVAHRDPTYKATPLGFAIYDCTVARRHPEGDFPGVVRLLLEAGTPVDEHQYPSGDPGIDAVIEAHRRKSP